jgi:hypothetical protein
VCLVPCSLSLVSADPFTELPWDVRALSTVDKIDSLSTLFGYGFATLSWGFAIAVESAHVLMVRRSDCNSHASLSLVTHVLEDLKPTFALGHFTVLLTKENVTKMWPVTIYREIVSLAGDRETKVDKARYLKLDVPGIICR